MRLTPEQRYKLVTDTLDRLTELGLVLVPVTSGQPWKVQCESVRLAYNELQKQVRAMALEIDWPGSRPMGGHLDRG